MFFSRFYFNAVISVFLIILGIGSVSFSKAVFCQKSNVIFQKRTQESSILLANLSEQEIPIFQEERKNFYAFFSGEFLPKDFYFVLDLSINSIFHFSKIVFKNKFFDSFVRLRSIP